MSDKRWDELDENLRAAWCAEVPELPRIQRCREELKDHIVRRTVELIQRDEAMRERKKRLRKELRIVARNASSGTDRYGLCSPAKSAGMWSLENKVREVFGPGVRVCETRWLSGDDLR